MIPALDHDQSAKRICSDMGINMLYKTKAITADLAKYF